MFSSLFQSLAIRVTPLEMGFVVLLCIPFLFFLACVLYLLRLLMNAILLRSRLAEVSPTGHNATQITPVAALDGNQPRFVLLIPAHNEELLLEDALISLFQLDYPRDAFHVVVIADNCSDNTAKIARKTGAIALERFNKTLIGKGYALEWALDKLLYLGNPEIFAKNQRPVPEVSEEEKDTLAPTLNFDAVVILDADTQVAGNMLQVFAQRLRGNDKVLQARYEVLNVAESWRTRLMSCALALAHIIKPLGRERLRLSDGLKGNGMCFAREVVEQVPWSGESITEDIEYTLRLCRAGYRVGFSPETAVWAQMPTTGEQSVSQRKRWEGGRYHLLTKVAPSVLAEGFKNRNMKLIDRAIELIIPPFAEMFALPVVLGMVSLALGLIFQWNLMLWLAAGWGVVLLLQAIYLFVGMWAAKVPAKIATTVLYAPFYIVWKLGVYAAMLVKRSAGGWQRTERHRSN